MLLTTKQWKLAWLSEGRKQKQQKKQQKQRRQERHPSLQVVVGVQGLTSQMQAVFACDGKRVVSKRG